jgi:vacuolar-type H+-ATPase subunit F/Vma7
MIAIIYPKYDELAREIAVKTGLNYDNVYVAPTYRISEKEVLKDLQKANYGIMIVFDPTVQIDEKTKRRYMFLKNRVKEMLVLIPSNKRLNETNERIKVLKYKSNNHNDLVNKLEILLKELKSKRDKENNDEISILILLLMVFIASFLITSNHSSKLT